MMIVMKGGKGDPYIDAKKYERALLHIDIKWSRDRKGLMCSSEITTLLSDRGCIEVATPPEFPKGIPGIWSPEHLFTASVVSCFMTTFLAIADNSKLAFTGFTCRAAGKLEEADGRMIMSSVALYPEVTVTDASSREKAVRVMERAEKSCLISHSIKSTVTMDSAVIVDTKVGADDQIQMAS